MIRSIGRAVAIGAMVAGTLFVAQSASAATVFSFTNKGSTSAAGVNSYTFASNDGSMSVKATAWHANDRNTSAVTTDTISRAKLGFWSNGGLGVIYGTDSAANGMHQIDNAGSGAGADFVMLQFDRDVTIDSLSRNVYRMSGVACCDSDAAFWADTSNIFGAPSLSANLSLTSSQFNESIFTTLTGNGSSGTTKLGSSIAASVWFISAAHNQKNDGFKISDLTVITAVPEPATWAMMVLGFGFVGAAMRRRIRVSEANFTNKIRALAEA
ncbi:PEPxxWA-CTERM sorting domain-containing protein [Sphingomonas qilianensis]|uniref:PEPxxWA-CTERM sorting domain-containing protein n=1 Tax=Sphingomonas qilianensis TaxID=1736690 RepID=A0ABU9XQK7_9SPHN